MTRGEKPGVNQGRTYRQLHHGAGLHYFRVCEGETDLHIGASRAVPDIARTAALEARSHVLDAIRRSPDFLTSFSPVTLDGALPVADAMIRVSAACGVGPMAAVAGAIAAHVGRAIIGAGAGDVVVENGGDLFIRCAAPRVIAIYAGDSPLSGRLGVRVFAPLGCGVCTSAGRVGPSVSFGDADAVTVISDDAALADACATAAGNLVTGDDGLHAAVSFASAIPGIRGALAIRGDKLAAWGNMELVRIE